MTRGWWSGTTRSKPTARRLRNFPLPNTTVARYDGSFFKLRKEIDHLLNDGQPPRLVVYVPIERTETNSALIELDCAGVIMQPRQQPPACNTRLSVVARNALKPILGEDQVAEIERQVEAGKLSLADLNSLADKGKDISTGVLTLIFGSANPQEVALAFLHSDQYDEEIGKKEAEKELRHLLQVSFDIELPAAEALSNWRVRLGRHVLLTDLFAALKKQVPSSLSSVPVATSTGGIDACVRLARTWRNSRDVRDSYVTVANKVEQELGLGQLELPVEPLKENETFLCVERALLVHVESELLKAATPALLQLAEYRLSRFWADVMPAIQARWALISSAAEVLIEADRVGKALKKAPTTVPALVKAYADDDEPWCLLDTHHRHMESRKYNFEFAASDDHHGLEKLITKAEQRYTEVGSELAKHFITQFQKAKHPIKGLLRQRDIFEKQVKPLLGEGKVAYVWVDALRFEMARELCRLLKDDFKLEIQPAIGTIPTITEIGMAALLPKANESAKVVAVGGGKLALEIGGKVIKDRKDRVAFLKEHAGVSVFDAKLDDLLPKPAKKVKDGIQSAQLILITSQEIDELGEADNMAQARLQMDGVLSHLRRGVQGAGRSRHQDDRPGGRPRPSVCRRDRRGHEDRGPRWQGCRPASPGLGGRWGNFGAVVSADLAGLVGSGQRIRHRDPVDLRCLQVEGRRASLFPRRTVSARTDRSRGRDALGGEVLGPLDRHSMDADPRHGETDHTVLLRADCREPERVEPVRI